MTINRTKEMKQRWRRTNVITLTAFSLLGVTLLATSPSSVHAAGGDATGNPERGKQLFDKRCGGCHSLDRDGEGPRLSNIYGHKAGNTPTFKYSTALKSSNLIWDEPSLDKWLKNPESLVPDTDMDFQVAKADERADIIRYLKTISGK